MLYTYRLLEVVRIVDGDTYDLILDVGFHSRQASRFRLAGYDTPEVYWHGASDFEKSKGAEATAFAQQWMSEHSGEVLATTKKDPDSFGRWLVNLHLDGGGLSLGEQLAQRELATQWPTRWRETYGQ